MLLHDVCARLTPHAALLAPLQRLSPISPSPLENCCLSECARIPSSVLCAVIHAGSMSARTSTQQLVKEHASQHADGQPKQEGTRAGTAKSLQCRRCFRASALICRANVTCDVRAQRRRPTENLACTSSHRKQSRRHRSNCTFHGAACIKCAHKEHN